MTRQKTFKSRVRARMVKTGERYAAARRQLIDAGPTEADPARDQAVGDTAAIAGSRKSEEAVRTRTGSSWDEWFGLLDDWQATTRNHTEIARWLREEIGVDSWWAQSITVAYEQERGMRVPGQQSDGGFAASASKTIAVPAERLTEAFTDPELRARWLPDLPLTIRTARPGKSLTADLADGSGRLAVGFTAKGEAKSQVALQHRRLTDAAAAATQKAYWRDRVAALKALLEGEG